MKRNILNSLVIMGFAICFAACSPKKVLVKTDAKIENVEDNSKEENLNLIQQKRLNFNTLSLKAKANLTLDGDNNDVNMNIRIMRDKQIWVSVNAMGLVEVARALITPDSIKIMNKIKSEYIKKPFSYIYNFTNKEVDFSTLQNILTGNVIENNLPKDVELKVNADVLTLLMRKNALDMKTTFNSLYRPAETFLNDAAAGQALAVKYDNYQSANSLLFPSNMSIDTRTKDTDLKLILAFTQIDANIPLEFPFSVSKRFQVIN